MTTDAFWDIVNAAKTTSDGTWDRRLERLAELLAKLPPAEVVEFQRNFREQRARAYTWDLWGAAVILGEGCSDDSFMDFRAWLISMGKDVFETALRDPDTTLADINFGPNPGEEEYMFFEDYNYVARQVYVKMTGTEMDLPVYEPDEPTGTDWEEDDLPARYPRLWAQNSSTPTEPDPNTATQPESAERKWWEVWNR